MVHIKKKKDGGKRCPWKLIILHFTDHQQPLLHPQHGDGGGEVGGAAWGGSQIDQTSPGLWGGVEDEEPDHKWRVGLLV